MKIDILTLFPDFLTSFLEWSMIKKAREIKALDLKVHNLRDWGIDERGTVDDTPYGGGPGMILRIEPVYKALLALNPKPQTLNSKTIFLSPRGKVLNQKKAGQLSKKEHLILLCGHYEGIDERIRRHLIDEEISIGNYVLSGGELPAMTLVDAVSRLLPGVLEKEGASEIESFSPGLKKLLNDKYKMLNEQLLLEYPHYTRPPKFKGWKVPPVLLSGNHGKIKEWRAKKVKIKK
ncbi:tRNA (guanosine(37)-N1)-methyltransferase TrmD [Candidatus Shapirobacteria bacterium]|nr:tRNA (guanosine(37)-N1)-methyltransferase TrmD [Candidatus Shapirobacteria bacterium]